jgi:uncharacterized membrane protein
MLPEPLHPAVVHFPIVLVVLLPIVALISLVLIRRGASPRKAWIPVIALAVGLMGASWVAIQTGEREEEAVERVVGDRPIHEHEEAAELFLSLTAGMALLMAVGFTAGLPGRIARPVATAGAVLLVAAGYQVGHTGGDLVYEHGAGSAYASVGAEGRSNGSESRRSDGDDADDDDDAEDDDADEARSREGDDERSGG